MKRKQIAVIGSAGPEEYPKGIQNNPAYQTAYQIGKLLADKEITVLNGGKGGIMEMASKGAAEKGGISVGFVSGNTRKTSNNYTTVEIVTGSLNNIEESLLISSADGVIVIGGGAGTLQEIALAYRMNKPIVALTSVSGWGKQLAGRYLDKRRKTKIGSASSPKIAVNQILKKI